MDVGESLILRNATEEDGVTILGEIRQEDIEEWNASIEGGICWLRDSIRQSTEAVSLVDKATGHPIVIFGVIPRDRLPTDIWMVASVFGPPRAMVAWHLCIDWIEGFWRRWPDVHCWSDARNLVHHRWLEWLGFQRGPRDRPWGHLGLPFHYYRRINND